MKSPADVQYAHRVVKRRLSTIEKSSIHTVAGSALIMPAVPGTEVEELLRMGFDPTDLVVIEHDAERARELYEYYFERHEGLRIHLITASEYLQRGSHLLTYAHLDYEGNVDTGKLSDLEYLILHRLAPYARVRFSVSINRGHKTNGLRAEEKYLALISKLAELGRMFDKVRVTTFNAYESEIRANHLNLAHFFGVTMFVSAFFGLDVTEFLAADITDLQPKGTHLVRDPFYVNHYEGGDAARTQMASTWVDLVPLPLEILAHNYDQWVGREIAELLRRLEDPVIEFTEL